MASYGEAIAANAVSEAMASRRSHYKLNQVLIDRAGRLAALGWSQKAIAQACGVSDESFRIWLNNAETEDATELELGLFGVIQEAATAGEEALAQKIANGDTKDAQWLLTHAARWRDNWSDAAAVRREVQAVVGAMVEVVLGSELTPEQQDRMFLRMRAAGIGAPAS